MEWRSSSVVPVLKILIIFLVKHGPFGHFPGDLSPFCLIFQFFVGPVLVNTVVLKSLCQLSGFGRCGFKQTQHYGLLVSMG